MNECTKPKIVVLLATFNGEAYLNVQLKRVFLNMFKMIIYSLWVKDSQIRRCFILLGLKAALQKKVGKIDIDVIGDTK